MRIYLAARYSRKAEMREVRDRLVIEGHEITSRWIDLAHCNEDAQVDVDDLNDADWVVSFTSGGGGKGGRHVEFGMAVALGKRLSVIGPREHAFHTLPQVEHYAAWPEFLAAVEAERASTP